MKIFEERKNPKIPRYEELFENSEGISPSMMGKFSHFPQRSQTFKI
jgi:hypothetical protein